MPALAMASTVPGGLTPPAGAVAVVEYYRSDLDHYYYTADPAEISFIDGNPAALNKRTGFFFFAWLDPASAPPGAQPVCKFFGSRAAYIDSYYYTSSPAECAFVSATWPGTWTLVNPAAFWVMPVYPDGTCPSGHARHVPVRQQPEGLQSAPHDRPLRAPRDDQPGVGAGWVGEERRRVLHADLGALAAAATTGRRRDPPAVFIAGAQPAPAGASTAAHSLISA